MLYNYSKLKRQKMKHAICVIGYGENAAVLQKTINILDDNDIDFFIHWDSKYKLPKLYSNHSHIYFIKNRISVKWGSFTQIKAELLLLKLVENRNIYDYVHLISSNDIPLMTPTYFKKFFNHEVYIGFDKKFTQKEAIKRVGYYYPSNIDFRKHKFIRKFLICENKYFKINRLRNHPNLKIEKGPNWFSIKTKYINEILNSNIKIFEHSYCADELFIQTILQRFKSYQIKSEDDNKQAVRYIDWHRGGPYIFTINDVAELKSKVNTKYAFARKIKNPQIINSIFKD